MNAAIEIPAEFSACATLPLRDLAERFHVSPTTARKWRQQLGITGKNGAPAGNRNGVGNASRRKRTHGIDGPERIRICLSCSAARCSGDCVKLRMTQL